MDKEDTLRASVMLGMMDNLKLAHLAHCAVRQQAFEICTPICEEINRRAYAGRLNDLYYAAAQQMGFTNNALFRQAIAINGSIAT